MRYVLAFFCPWLTFVTIWEKSAGRFCVFCYSGPSFGWLPAVIWAASSVGGYNADQRTDRVVDAINKGNAASRPAAAPPIPDYVPPPRPRQTAGPIPTVESDPSLPACRTHARYVLPCRRRIQPGERAQLPAGSFVRRTQVACAHKVRRRIAAAAKRAREFGAHCEDDLARSYLRLNDTATASARKPMRPRSLSRKLTAAFLCAHLGVEGQLRHADYIGTWIALLKEDNRAVFTAASKASQAANFLRSFSEDAAEEE